MLSDFLSSSLPELLEPRIKAYYKQQIIERDDGLTTFMIPTAAAPVNSDSQVF